MQERARRRHDTRSFVKMYDKSLSDSMEALLAACFLNMGAWRVARLLHFLDLSIEPSPTRLLGVGAACSTWVPLLLTAPHRAIDPTFATEHSLVVARRQMEVEARMKAHSVDPASGDAASWFTVVQSVNIHHELDNRRLELEPLQVILGYRFRRINILLQALTHSTSSSLLKWGCYQRYSCFSAFLCRSIFCYLCRPQTLGLKGFYCVEFDLRPRMPS